MFNLGGRYLRTILTEQFIILEQHNKLARLTDQNITVSLFKVTILTSFGASIGKLIKLVMVNISGNRLFV